MDLGLYNLKYPFRKFISWLLPMVKDVSPNAISWSLLPVGALTGLCYYYAGRYPYLLAAGAVLIFVRMVVSTLDGLVAVTYDKSTPEGEIVNRVTPELCDLMLITPIVASRPGLLNLGIVVLAMAWLTSFAGLIGLAGGKPIQSVGPVGQTDRITALMVLSLVGFGGYLAEQRWDVVQWFLWWCVSGGVLTVVLRLYRVLAVGRDTRAAVDQANAREGTSVGA